MCVLRETLIGQHFDVDSYTEITGDRGECYSNWIFNNNLNPTIKSITASRGDPLKATDGLYIYDTIGMMYTSYGDNKKTITFEMDELKMLEKIVLKTRTGSRWNFMGDVIVSTSIDGQKYKEFYTTPSNVDHGEVLIGTGIKEQVKVKFIKITATSTYLQLPEVVLIGKTLN